MSGAGESRLAIGNAQKIKRLIEELGNEIEIARSIGLRVNAEVWEHGGVESYRLTDLSGEIKLEVTQTVVILQDE